MPTDQNPLAALLAKNLRVGAVLYKWCDFTTPSKNKYMVVASLEPKLLILLINSKINQYYVDKGLDQFHVQIPQADHEFLKHDSYADCIEAHTAFDCSNIRQEVIESYNDIFQGWLTDTCLENVYHAVNNNEVIRQGHKKEITASIEEQLPHLK